MEGTFFPSSGPVWLIIILGFASLLATLVGVWRKYKAGELEDDGTLIDRLNADNKNLRAQLDLINLKYEDERIQRRHAEDVAAIYFRQLIENNIQPKKVEKHGQSHS